MLVQSNHTHLFAALLGSLIVLAFVMLPAGTTAQSRGSISVSMDFSFPAPGETVRLKLEAQSFNLLTSRITWVINEEVVAQAYGLAQHTLEVGPAGTTYTVAVTAEPQSGPTVTTSMTFTIGSIDFVWEADTYTPPFFLGRPLHTQGAGITVGAIPMLYKSDGSLYDPSELFYKWTSEALDTSVRKEGRGLSSIHTQDRRSSGSHRFTVEIMDDEGRVIAADTVSVPPTSPQVHLYVDNPLRGVLYSTVIPGTYILRGDELRIVAEPYYMSVQSRSDSVLNYSWDVADSKLSIPGVLVLRPEGEGEGRARVRVTILHDERLLQSGRAETYIDYSLMSSGTIGANTEAL